ncbi:HAD family hydrolase [Microbacterium amylolyticum]|uniref:Hydroxymethylpyrimidine pyrophosphatase-like HAD family hydrolase n=1 Tax=Microbacterium amylolyticum TaxID=936337 RepID=A0ABS4ZEI4_9MICO|nr:HAD family hydrolase [Microbacterium amylolyticum]MBP2435702.1 hydroxymethylpyrimidine pyrophosphatase-like HAD family hydrolase [Microbacterium amylolyticum]
MSSPEDWSVVLATDLDGTFLGGSSRQRRILYDWITANRSHVGLIFVTGRDSAYIERLCSDGADAWRGDRVIAPWPDYVIGDVGTTIAGIDNGTVTPLPELEEHIRHAWQDRGDWTREVLSDAPGLTEQNTPFRHRVSYHWDPDRYDPASVAPLEKAGLDILISHGCYLDVLPGGVSKGPSLLRLIAQLGIDRDRVLVAGDTGNDLSMFQTGLRGAVVGNAEQDLVDATAHLESAYRCALPGAAGIAEAIRAMSLHPTPPQEVSA